MYKPGPSKGYIRDSVFLYFMECSYVLTLPNLYFGLEKMFVIDGKRVDCAEYKVNTFKGMSQIKPEGVRLYRDNVANLEIEKYDGIFLDFFGTFNRHTSAVLERVQSGTKLAMTFLMARENLQLQRHIDIKNREESYVRLLDKYGITIEKYANYCDTVPMCVFFGYKR